MRHCPSTRVIVKSKLSQRLGGATSYRPSVSIVAATRTRTLKTSCCPLTRRTVGSPPT